MENFKRSVKRLLTRLTILSLVVVCGAIAIAQANANKDRPGAAPDLGQPGGTMNDVSKSMTALSAVPVPQAEQWTGADSVPAYSAEQTGQARQTEQEQPAGYKTRVQPSARAEIVDTNVQQAQAQADVRDQDAFSADPSQHPAPPPTDRFGVGADRFGGDVGSLEAPALIEDVSAAQPRSDLGLPADDSLPALPPARFSGDLVREVLPAGQPAALPAARTEAQPEVASDRFGETATAPADGGNRLRPRQSLAAIPAPAETQAYTPRAAQPAAVQPPPAYAPELERRADPNPYANESLRNAEPRNLEPRVYETPAAQNNFAQQREFDSAPGYSDNRNFAASTGPAGVGKPGARELEGPQNSSLSIHKVAPRNVRIGAPATFQVKVRNNSQVTVEQVLIQDVVPLGTRLIQTTPQATTTADGALLWRIGTLAPSEEATVSMEISPEEEGTIGSVASVTYQAMASARAEVTKPMLNIKHSTKPKVLVGETVSFTIILENPGTGPATNVVIQEVIPQGLSHAKGPTLEYEVGTIPAGGQRRLELTMKAAEQGPVENVILASAEGGLTARDTVNLEVVAPDLDIKIAGPKNRYLERQATFTVAIENPGTAEARNVELVTTLPPGLKFISTNNSGRYDRSTNTIRWSLDKLPSRQFGEVKFTAVPVRKGNYKIDALATADRGLQSKTGHDLSVDGIAALMMEVSDQVDPIEVGGFTTYRIRVTNQGTKDATNVSFVAELPPGLRAAAPSAGGYEYRIDGGRVIFPPVVKLPAKGDATFQVRVEGVQVGDQRFQVKMTSDGKTKPVIEQESTQVYAD